MNKNIAADASRANCAGRIEHLFVVRIWLEAGGSVTWRGWIEHVASRERLYFTSLRDAYDFVQCRLGVHQTQRVNDAQAKESGQDNEK